MFKVQLKGMTIVADTLSVINPNADTIADLCLSDIRIATVDHIEFSVNNTVTINLFPLPCLWMTKGSYEMNRQFNDDGGEFIPSDTWSEVLMDRNTPFRQIASEIQDRIANLEK